MLVAIEADNTNIELAVFDENKLVYCGKISAQSQRTADEFGAVFIELLGMKGVAVEKVDGAIISCVVPSLSMQLKLAVNRIFGVNAIVVSSGVKTGLNIRLDDPADLGSDMVCACVCAKKEYKLPIIVIDLSTATKIYAIDKNGAMIGGTISSGVKISVEALSSKTAALPQISAESVATVIGTNTVDAMKSGVFHGTGGMIDGMVERFEQEMGCRCTKLITGEFSHALVPYCNTKLIEDSFLKLKGLNYIFKLNVENNPKYGAK